MAKTKSCSQGTCIIIVVVIILLAGAAGVAVWLLLPEETEDLLGQISNVTKNKGGNNNNNNDSGNNPVSDYKYFQCDDMSNCCNGLDTICDLRIDEVLFATAHNAMSTEEDGYPYLIVTGPNHLRPLEDALEKGYRGLSIDVCNCGDGGLQLCHGVCDIAPRDPKEVFGNIVTFLKANPSEVVMLNIQINNEARNGGVPVDIFELYSIMDSVPDFTNMMYDHDLNVEASGTTDWPTLRSLVDTNRRIVIFHFNGPVCNDDQPCPSGLHYWFRYGAETRYQFASIEEIEDVSYSCELTRGSGTFLGINNFITPPSESSAKVINKRDFVEKRMADCSELIGNNLDANVVFVDFWSLGDLIEVQQEHNKALAVEIAGS